MPCKSSRPVVGKPCRHARQKLPSSCEMVWSHSKPHPLSCLRHPFVASAPHIDSCLRPLQASDSQAACNLTRAWRDCCCSPSPWQAPISPLPWAPLATPLPSEMVLEVSNTHTHPHLVVKCCPDVWWPPGRATGREGLSSCLHQHLTPPVAQQTPTHLTHLHDIHTYGQHNDKVQYGHPQKEIRGTYVRSAALLLHRMNKPQPHTGHMSHS